MRFAVEPSLALSKLKTGSWTFYETLTPVCGKLLGNRLCYVDRL